jgi:hypothetical protein
VNITSFVNLTGVAIAAIGLVLLMNIWRRSADGQGLLNPGFHISKKRCGILIAVGLAIMFLSALYRECESYVEQNAESIISQLEERTGTEPEQ